jgi:uncharacterized membrane protein HdeD (DUF308 family)
MPASTPWKADVIGAVGIAAGAALLPADWPVAPLAVFVGLALVARAALHLVAARSFVGFEGAFAVLEIAGDAGVGITVLAWPGPTPLSLAVPVGLWAVVRAIVGVTIAITTHVENSWWPLSIVFAVAVGVLGATVIARSGGSLRSITVVLGLLMLVEGAREAADGALRQHRERLRSGGARPSSIGVS